ncbi:MAG: ABC transporter permease [Euryarchaeota archaeon]|nr:ABC transporter permease [Euryarchaeota archaeon]
MPIEPSPAAPVFSRTTLAWGRTFRATYVSNFKGQLRYYTTSGWMISSLLSPVFLLASAAVIAHFLAGGGVPPRFFELTGYPDYLAFVVIGLATNGLVNSALDDGGTAIYDEESAGTWDLIALTPTNRFVWIFGKTLAGMTASILDLVIVLAAGVLIFGIVLTPANLTVALVGLLLTLIGLQGFGFLMAAAGLYWKQPYALAMLFSPVFIFLSGMVFPVEALPGWVQAISSAFPLTHGLHIMRDAVLLGKGFTDLTQSFSMLVLTGAAFMIVGFAAFAAMEKRARRHGVLGRY